MFQAFYVLDSGKTLAVYSRPNFITNKMELIISETCKKGWERGNRSPNILACLFAASGFVKYWYLAFQGLTFSKVAHHLEQWGGGRGILMNGFLTPPHLCGSSPAGLCSHREPGGRASRLPSGPLSGPGEPPAGCLVAVWMPHSGLPGVIQLQQVEVKFESRNFIFEKGTVFFFLIFRVRLNTRKKERAFGPSSSIKMVATTERSLLLFSLLLKWWNLEQGHSGWPLRSKVVWMSKDALLSSKGRNQHFEFFSGWFIWAITRVVFAWNVGSYIQSHSLCILLDVGMN